MPSKLAPMLASRRARERHPVRGLRGYGMTRIRPPAVVRLFAYALALVICLGSCALLRPRPPIADALHARRLMVPVAGVSPAQVPDTFRSPRGRRIHGAVDI